MRANDVVARFGGEEFVAMLPGTMTDAVIAAERVRLAFEAAGRTIGERHLAATVSVGAACGAPTAPVAQLIAPADAALYRAKRNGRNRVEGMDETLPGAVTGVSQPDPSQWPRRSHALSGAAAHGAA